MNKTNKIKNNKHNQGQVAIIVLLVSAVLLTLGMSASKKTITDIKVDTDEESLKEAFNTAESGINNYLNGGGFTYTDSTGAGATVVSTPIGGNNIKSLSTEGPAAVNSPQFFWLVNHTDAGDIGTTYYGSDFKIESSESLNNVALKVDYYYITAGGVYSVNRFGCHTGSNTAFVGFTGDCSNIAKGTNNPLLVVVTPLGSSTTLTISGASSFPLQGEELTSTGTVNNGIKTQIKTRHTYQIPSFLIDSITAIGTVQ